MVFRKFLMIATPDPIIPPSFTLEVKSDNAGTSGTNQFTIPTTTGTYLYDYTTSDGQSGTGITGDETITFASGVGTYEIYITGTFPRIYFNNGGDKLKLLRVLEWGDYGVGETDQRNMFNGCTNLTSIADDVDNLNLTVLGDFMFYFCSLTSLPSGLTLPNLTSATSMFRNNNLTSLPVGMTLPNLTSATSMFYGNGIIALPSGMILDSLIIGSTMFFQTSLTDLPVGMTLPNLTNGVNIFLDLTINTTRYSQLLVDLESGNANNSVTFHGGNSKYNATGETARDILTGGVRLWTITDGGLEI